MIKNPMKNIYEQQKSEDYLESCGFEVYEYQPHLLRSVFVRFISGMPVYKTVVNGEIIDGIVEE